jgi:hypothetical protein
MWQEREMMKDKKRKRKNRSPGIHRGSIFDTLSIVRNILTRQF